MLHISGNSSAESFSIMDHTGAAIIEPTYLFVVSPAVVADYSAHVVETTNAETKLKEPGTDFGAQLPISSHNLFGNTRSS